MTSKENKQNDTLEEYLQIKNESRLATTLFVVYTLLLFVVGFWLVSKGARVHTFSYLGVSIYIAVGMRIFIPPFHKKAYLELAQPELKQYSSKGVSVSQSFLQKQVIAYIMVVLVMGFVTVQALQNIPQKVEIVNYPVTDTSTSSEETTTIPSLGNAQ
ncbi:hypothetical protein [Streptococcus loxodontisalivarius]|uniref:Uncharacterized protein n=1 Tax=Streptococcus loxodontisalivarius TaxID=1349415 RepID=A0ABS2PPP0_9STRE|nr:hypothetical protein [Streptococcus loxodontisalivarius]MBM7641997.1 hypothetical protein [Streptococcus loxodontisalivarius]